MFPFLYYILVVHLFSKIVARIAPCLPCGFLEWHFTVRFFQDFLCYYNIASDSITFLLLFILSYLNGLAIPEFLSETDCKGKPFF